MTLNGRAALYCTHDAYFEAHHGKRHIHTINGKNVAQRLYFEAVLGSCDEDDNDDDADCRLF